MHSPEAYESYWSKEEAYVLSEIFLAIDDHDDIKRLLEVVTYRPQKGIQQRIFRWLRTLVDHRSVGGDSFKSLVIGVLKCADDFPMLLEQTLPQFNCSAQYLVTALQANIDYLYHKMERGIIINIIILSQRPDLQKQSLKKALSLTVTAEIEGLFEVLFCKPDQLSFLARHFNYNSKEVINLAVSLADGKSLRKSLPAHLFISKKTNALFHTIKYKFKADEDLVLEKYVVFYTLLALQPEEKNMLETMCEYSDIYKKKFITFFNDLDFWKTIYLFFVKHKKELQDIDQYNQVKEYLDFFEHQRYFSEPPFQFSLKNRTFKSVERSIRTWHVDEIYKNFELDDTEWKGLGLKTFKNEQFYINEITTTKRLVIEGKVLHHCAISYQNKCLNGSSNLFSFYEIINETEAPLFTIEISQNEIFQLAGNFNCEAPEEIKNIVSIWATQNNIHLGILVKSTKKL